MLISSPFKGSANASFHFSLWTSNDLTLHTPNLSSFPEQYES